jgi:hypothetical protein
MSSVRVPQTSKPLEAYMVINFRTRGISRSARKLAQTLTLIIIKNIYVVGTTFTPVANKIYNMLGILPASFAKTLSFFKKKKL